jgi:hypothetical protein
MDKVSGFAGIVTGRCFYLYEETKCQVEPECLISGIPVVAQWLTESRLEPYKVKKIGYTKEKK